MSEQKGDEAAVVTRVSWERPNDGKDDVLYEIDLNLHRSEQSVDGGESHSVHIDDELYRKLNKVYQFPDPNLVLLRSELTGVGINPFGEYKSVKETESFDIVEVRNVTVNVGKLKETLNVSGLKDDEGNAATKDYMLNNVNSVSFAEEFRNAESYYLNVLLDDVWTICSYAKGERNEKYDVVWHFTKPVHAANA